VTPDSRKTLSLPSVSLPTVLVPALVLAPVLCLASGAPLAAQTRYLAFGDSLTFGVGDPEGEGYPPRLEALLEERGFPATVASSGVPGETTAEGLSRIIEVLDVEADVLLLMEGTNDIGGRISPETIRFNLQEMAQRAADRGVETVHLTIVPRLPSANFDGANRVTGELAALVRELAWSRGEELADPFEVLLFQTPGVFEDLYVGGEDKLHLNPAGYDRLAEIVADVLTGVDAVPPVPGVVTPTNDEQRVDPFTEVRVDLFDFGAGIDLDFTELRINGKLVPQTLTGDSRRVTLSFQPTEPLGGVVFVEARSQDFASPVNALERELVQFVVAGTEFLAGDIDRDGRVDGADLVAFAVRFGSQRGDGVFRAFADLNGDDVVDGLDLALLASNFGQSAG